MRVVDYDTKSRKTSALSGSIHNRTCTEHYLLGLLFCGSNNPLSRSQWPRGLRRRSSAARLLRFWFRIPPGAWMFVCCECCVLAGRSLCDGLITRPEESYRLWCVVVCDQKTSKTRRLKPATGLWKYKHSGFNARKTNKQTNSNPLNRNPMVANN
jgi:hypothetical protein